MDRWEASRGDRGICRECPREYQLTRKGLVRQHVNVDTRRDCPGSGKPPREHS